MMRVLPRTLPFVAVERSSSFVVSVGVDTSTAATLFSTSASFDAMMVLLLGVLDLRIPGMKNAGNKE